MEIILREDVRNLGKAGDVVNVREGYARNFLLPRKKAVVADSGNMKRLEHEKRVITAKQQKMKKGAEELAQKISAMSITIGREAGEEEKLFGSVTTKDIADALRNEGVIVDKHDILLDEPLKKIGIFDVGLRVHSDVKATVKVWVVKK
jgi:large subunit ribosomal protein L9